MAEIATIWQGRVGQSAPAGPPSPDPADDVAHRDLNPQHARPERYRHETTLLEQIDLKRHPCTVGTYRKDNGPVRLDPRQLFLRGRVRQQPDRGTRPRVEFVLDKRPEPIADFYHRREGVAALLEAEVNEAIENGGSEDARRR